MQKRYEDLIPQEKGTLLISSDVYAFLGSDPKVGIDYCGFSGTIELPVYFDIKNASTLSLYFKIEATVLSGDPAKWSSLSSTFPVINANSSASLQFIPKREVPSSYLEETLRISVKAFKDSGYTELFGEDYVDYTYYFFDHTQGTIVHFGDFETGKDGWTSNATDFLRKNKYAYTGAYSIYVFDRDHGSATIDSSGCKIIPQTIYVTQTFDLSSYSKVFFVLHITYYKYNSGYSAVKGVRIWTSNEDYFIRFDLPENTFRPLRVAVPITPGSSVSIKWITGWCGAQSWFYVDTLMVVGFS